MSAGSSGMRPDAEPALADDDARQPAPDLPEQVRAADAPAEGPAAEQVRAADAPPEEPAPEQGRWRPSDWDGLLARPPGLSSPSPAASTNGASGNGSTGTGWPVPPGGRSLLVASGRRAQPEVVEEGPAGLSAAGAPSAREPEPAQPEAPAGAVEPMHAAEQMPALGTPTPVTAPAEAGQPAEVGLTAAVTLAPAASPPTAEPTSTALSTGLPLPSPQPVDAPTAAPASTRWSLESWSLRRLVTVSASLVLATVMAAYLASAFQPTVYGAQADLLFEVAGSSQEAERQLATQEVLIGSRGVLAPVAERLDVPLRDLTRAVDVEQIAGSQVLRLQVRNEDPDLAVRLAQAIADSYVESVSSGAVAAGSDEENRLRNEIAGLSVTAAAGRARLDQIAAERAAGSVTQAATQEERRLQLEDTTLSQRLGTLQTQLTQMLVKRDSANPAEILTPAYLLDDPIGPKPIRGAAAGLMLSLVMVGLLGALWVRQHPQRTS